MRNTIIFTTILIIAIAAGLKLTSVTNRILSKNDDRSTIIDRDDIKSDAVYITPSDNSNFDPFSIIETDTAVPLNYNNSNSGKLFSSDIVETIFRHSSRYSHYTEFARPADKDFQACLYIDSNGMIYVQKYAYYNNYGDLRYVDLIIEDGFFQIIYINFYDDNELKSNSSEIEEAVTNMESYLSSFYDNLANYEPNAWISGIEIPIQEYGEGINIDEKYGIPLRSSMSDEKFTDRTEAKNALDEEFINITDQIYSDEDYTIPNPYSQFIRHLSIPSLIDYLYPYTYYTDEGEAVYTDQYVYMSGISNIVYDICYQDTYRNNSIKPSKYFVKNGRIYQVIRENNSDLFIIIYNPVTQLPEGYLYNYADEIW